MWSRHTRLKLRLITHIVICRLLTAKDPSRSSRRAIARCGAAGSRLQPQLDDLHDVDRKQHGVKQKHGIKVSCDAVKDEQDIACDGKPTQRHDGIHAKSCEHGQRCQISHKIDPGHCILAVPMRVKNRGSARELWPSADSCHLTIPLISVGRCCRHCGCRRIIFRSVGQVLAQACKSKYGQRKGAIDDQHTPGPISQHAAVFRR
jgi:hypothetical protein